MSYSRAWLVGAAVGGVLAAVFVVSCVSDSDVPGPDASGPDGTAGPDGGGGNDVAVKDSTPPTDGPTGCAARTADDTAGVFVAQGLGTDVNGCGTRSNACNSIAYGIAAAKAGTAKTTIYLAAPPATDAGPGAYVESVVLDGPFTIEGGWNDTGGTWTPICDTTTSTAVTIQGVSDKAITASFTGSATLRDIRVLSKATAATGETLYGIFATGSTTNLTLDAVVVDVATGGVGVDGTNGTNGTAGSTAGCATGTGSTGGVGPNGSASAAGTFSSSGYTPTSGGNASDGVAGTNGTTGAAGTCSTAGNCALMCSVQQCSTTNKGNVCGANGLAGCAGTIGTGGTLGTGGGSSIGVFVWDAHLTVFGGTISSSNGGNGGSGGAGGDGGAGQSGVVGSAVECVTNWSCNGNACSFIAGTSEPGGNAGGKGGNGGAGGHGGGGSGGDSYAFVQGGDGGVTFNGNPTIMHGDAGTGGAVSGANGTAADKFP
jgi:hypothetical protein